MPSFATDSGPPRPSGLPLNLISPPLRRTVFEIARSVVVLPAPFAPSTATTFPPSTVSETPCTALTGRQRASTSSSSSSGIDLATEVRVDHLRVALHGGGRTVGDR